MAAADTDRQHLLGTQESSTRGDAGSGAATNRWTRIVMGLAGIVMLLVLGAVGLSNPGLKATVLSYFPSGSDADGEPDIGESAHAAALRFAGTAMEDAKDRAQKACQSVQGAAEKLDRRIRGFDPEDITTTANSTLESPPNAERADTEYGRCRCANGRQWVTFWPEGHKDQAVKVDVKTVRWIKWGFNVKQVHWYCDGMTFYKETNLAVSKDQWASLQLYTEEKKDALGIGWCGKETGMLHFNIWDATPHISSVPFTTKTDGYACMKIPALLRTNKNTLIAFAEARSPDCDDFARTDLVYKRSTDGGRTWSPLQKMVDTDEEEGNSSGVCGHPLVIGNIAPVQMAADAAHHPNRILAPYTRNNFKSWVVYSDDDGQTWTGDREIPGGSITEDEPDCKRGMDYLGFDIDVLDLSSVESLVGWVEHLCYQLRNPYHKWKKTLTGPWQFVGVGPPGSIQLNSGRVIVPGYHSYIRGLSAGKTKDGTVLPISQLYNNFAEGHALVSDDGGDTWRLVTDYPIGNGLNENQMVELTNGDVLTNSRSLATGSTQKRLQSLSKDSGETWSASEFVHELPQPFNGCQGSTINMRGDPETLYVTTPDPPKANTVLQQVADLLKCKVQFTGRRRVTIWQSKDGGKTYPNKQVVDKGLSAQTSLQERDGKVVLLYEQADELPKYSVTDTLVGYLAGDVRVLLPSRFIYKEVDTPQETRKESPEHEIHHLREVNTP